ncbi:MAG: hypothetical protein N3C60_06650 [Calditerrivibrio sp.]|nr:hypothetical protein [Calditerrivibrio sp.]
MAKTMCKISPKDDLEKFLDAIEDPKYYCKSCGRVANKEKKLCKPEPIPYKEHKKKGESEGS